MPWHAYETAFSLPIAPVSILRPASGIARGVNYVINVRFSRSLVMVHGAPKANPAIRVFHEKEIIPRKIMREIDIDALIYKTFWGTLSPQAPIKA